MLSTDVQRSFGDAYLEATAAMRARFEARVLEAESWTEGLALALSDLADGVLADPATARLTVTDIRFAHRDMLCLCDEDRQATLASLARGWQHFHDGPVPEVQLEFLCGAIGHVIAGAIARDELDELPTRLIGLLAFADGRSVVV
jgi:hypothetical protein